VSPSTKKNENSEANTSSLEREPLFMTPEEVAHEFSVDKRTILKWAREGKLDCTRQSKKIIRFSRQYIISLGMQCPQGIKFESSTSRNKIGTADSNTPIKKGEERTSRESSWRNLRKEVTKCQ
jgi:hypothetical protein